MRLCTSTWLNIDLASGVSMASMAPLVSLTSPIARGHGSPSLVRARRRRAGDHAKMPASINGESDPSCEAPPGCSPSPIGNLGQPCQPLLHPRQASHQRRRPMALVPCAARARGHAPGCRVEALANERLCVNDFHRSREPAPADEQKLRRRIGRGREGIDVEASSVGDDSAGPPLRQRHTAGCGPGAPHHLQPPSSCALSGAFAFRFRRALSVAAVTSRLRCVNQVG